ncbi:UvrD-helicase domain-containing protein [Geobacter pickeringii]|uniref:DNA 3'-5' helicase n=1 Tax=Geobacter pickeringii TaxID=345632 RepID=A0A0B5BJ10_9BACT|nr:UvrD-helicase domain-containing protein [Geobacter pickeringii]AJE04455.1 DNA helicase II [Geobacter pickeringii]
MEYIADLHVHSPFSRATSRECDPAGLAAWARVKGIQVVGTGDFTHPGWLARLKELFVPVEPGFFRLRDENVPSPLPGLPAAPAPVRFMLSAEISCIYKRHGAVRKVHNLLYVPDLAAAERVSVRLAGIGNIESDGRPILGLDSRNLLEILLEAAPEGFLVPAHIWTPWFSLFGSKSGFDAVEECFGDLTPHVFALETGLSSDPEMNRMISALDRFTLISNSDCHSPGRLGREANLLATGFDFFSLRDALKENRRDRFRGTVEFFPEEGKYHLDGHRACGVCLEPSETRHLSGRCPVCGRPLTVGVLHRVLELADRDRPLFPEDAPEVFSMVPLPEVLGEILDVGPASKEVARQYARLVARFGSEFAILLHASGEELAEASPLLAEAIGRIRAGRVIRHGGYDGEYGTIRVFEEGEVARLAGQGGLFGDDTPRRGRKKAPAPRVPLPARQEKGAAPAVPAGPNPEQAEAIGCTDRQMLVAAGPGTGKTFTLVARLAALLERPDTVPERVWAITFTNRAAVEVRERLVRAAGAAGERVFVGTFHSLCLGWLRAAAPDLAVLGEESRDRFLRRLFPGLAKRERDSLAGEIAAFLHRAEGEGAADAPPEPVRRYLDELSRLALVDLDDVVPEAVRRLRRDASFRQRICGGVAHLFVDEFQDLNASQYTLVETLGREAEVFAIGDPDQAIYGFRGSCPAFFFRFAELPATRRLSLVRNYRSAAPIIEAASAVIARNRLRSGLILTAATWGSGSIELHRPTTATAEAEFIARRIEEFMGGTSHLSLATGRGGERGRGRSFGEIAVLYRLTKQADELAAALERRGIPFQLVGAVPYFLGSAARGLTRFVLAADGSREMAHWLALLRELSGIGAASIGRLEEALPLTGDFFSLAAAVELPPAAAGQAAALAQALERFRETAAQDGVAPALGEAAVFLGADGGHPDCRRLLTLAGSFGADLSAFARHLREYAAETVYDDRAEGVALMTLHAAKGLEFPVVFLAGCEEGLLPCALWQDADLEEERRLFYVGMTRAREALVLTAAVERPWCGPGERPLSRFVAEIPEHLVRKGVPPRNGSPARGSEQLTLF